MIKIFQTKALHTTSYLQRAVPADVMSILYSDMVYFAGLRNLRTVIVIVTNTNMPVIHKSAVAGCIKKIHRSKHQAALSRRHSAATTFVKLSSINLSDYCDLYFKTLLFRRNCPYEEKCESFKSNIGKLIAFCKQAISEKSFMDTPLTAVIEECYCQHKFSILVLADHFHVSIAYMSHLFKKEINVTFLITLG